MIIIPAEKSLDWRNPPVATLAIILINVIVLFAYQSNDDARWQAALDDYKKSNLVEREAPVYLDYVDKHASALEAVETKHYVEQYTEAALPPVIVQSNGFSWYLKEQVEKGDLDPSFWDDKRQRFTDLQQEISLFAFGFVPAHFTVKGFFGNMFLHGGFDHLFGNMIFLFICGFSLEIAFGRLWFLGLYLLAGCLSTLFSYAMNFGSYIPEVGASGAIAGLMGMFGGLYGMRKIRFFYWFAVFIGYFTAPALLIFPIWVANEVVGALWGEGYVNYYAHIGGLLAGFGLIYALRDRFLQVDTAYLDNEASPEEQLQMRIHEMWDLAGRLQMDRASKLGIDLLKQAPEDRQLLRQLYNVGKANPKGKFFHQIAARIFTNEGNDAYAAFKLDILKDYLQTAERPEALSADATRALIRPACVGGLHDESYRLAEHLIALHESDTSIRSNDSCKAIFRVLMLQLREKKSEETNRLMDFLEAVYPDEEETAMAVESINRVAG